MTGEERICAVPGCEKTLSEEQEKRGMILCESCEEAKMHLCEVCGKKLSPQRIKDGAVLCQDCEMGYGGPEMNYELDEEYPERTPSY